MFPHCHVDLAGSWTSSSMVFNVPSDQSKGVFTWKPSNTCYLNEILKTWSCCGQTRWDVPRRTMMPMQTAMMPAFALTLGLTRCARRRSCFFAKPLEKIEKYWEPLSGEGQLPTKDGISRGQIVEFLFLSSSLRIYMLAYWPLLPTRWHLSRCNLRCESEFVQSFYLQLSRSTEQFWVNYLLQLYEIVDTVDSRGKIAILTVDGYELTGIVNIWCGLIVWISQGVFLIFVELLCFL